MIQVISPLLDWAGFYQPPFEIKSEYDRVARNMLAFILCGVNKRWKICIAYEFTAKSYSAPPVIDIIYGIAQKAWQIGISIVSMPSDMGSCNRGV